MSDELNALIGKHFPKIRFRKDRMRLAGKTLATKGEASAREYLEKALSEDGAVAFDAQPPVKCKVVAKSRDFSEWPIIKASAAIQQRIYGMTAEEIQSYDAERRKILTSKAGQSQWFLEQGVDTAGFTAVQGLNLIFNHAFRRYQGVIKKVENRNRKALEAHSRATERQNTAPRPLPELEVTLDEHGRLLNPPGVNANLYCYQSMGLRPYIPTDGIELPPEYLGYCRDNDAALPLMVPKNRLDIPKGSPGYIPEHQRPFLSQNKGKRMRAWLSPQEDRKASLLVMVRVGEDWALMDARGLLRNARWRRLAPANVSLSGLLNLFTGDPVIDTKTGLCTFTYRPGIVPVQKKKGLVQGKRTKEVLEAYLDRGTSVAVVSVDLGQTHPIAAATSRVTVSAEGTLTAETVDRFLLQDLGISDGAVQGNPIERYRSKYDAMEHSFRQEAKNTLTPEQRQEVELAESSSEATKNRLCAELGLRSSDLPWSAMTSQTTYISEAYLAAGGDPEKTYCFFQAKKVKRRDSNWARAFRPRVSEETRKAYQEALWELKRVSDSFEKLSQWKSELARRIVNSVVSRAKTRSQCDVVIPIIEDLNVGFFHGKGKRLAGWDQMFTVKAENRWVIQALHKAFSDLAINRGLHVFEVCPQRTSMTCPQCHHCDSENRDGEKFRCTSCGSSFHADLEVATHNLVRVALSGKALPKPVASLTPSTTSKPRRLAMSKKQQTGVSSLDAP